MDTRFALISFLMMLLMIFGVFIYYSAFVPKDEHEKIMLSGTLALLIGSLSWILFAYRLTYASNPNPIELMISLLFYLYAITMLVGSTIERMPLHKIVITVPLWTLIVYVPIAKLVWGQSEMIAEGFKVYDFSGGLVVHLSAGVGAFVLAKKIPKRTQSTNNTEASSLYIGGLFIMLGWFAFNMAPAQVLNDHAIQVWFNTLVTVVFGGLTGCVTQGILDKKASLAGVFNGMITGLVGSTVSVGYVRGHEAAIIAVLISSICPCVIKKLNQHRIIDDTVDSFGMNAIGGFLGSIGFAVMMLKNGEIGMQVLASIIIAVWSYLGAHMTHKLSTVIEGGKRWHKSIK